MKKTGSMLTRAVRRAGQLVLILTSVLLLSTLVLVFSRPIKPWLTALLVVLAFALLVCAQIILWRRLQTNFSQQVQPAHPDSPLEKLLLDAIQHNTRDSIYLKDRQHRVVWGNDYMAKDSGKTIAEFIGHNDQELFGHEFGQGTALEEDEIFTSAMPLLSQIEKLVHGDSIVWSSTTKVPVEQDGQVKYILGITREFTEIIQQHQQLEYTAAHDHLTGLLNRTGITHTLAETLKQQQPLALLFIDLDDFKTFNDQYGHDFGDQVLIAVSRRLEVVLRKDDVVGRYAGDEFLVIARRVEAEAEAQVVAQKILNAFESPLLVNGQECLCSFSIGISRCDEQGVLQERTLAERLISSADKAMYWVKQNGKHGIQFGETIQ